MRLDPDVRLDLQDRARELGRLAGDVVERLDSGALDSYACSSIVEALQQANGLVRAAQRAAHRHLDDRSAANEVLTEMNERMGGPVADL